MVEIKDIVDRESLEAWLESKPKKLSQIITHRSAMRALPDYWYWAITSTRAQKENATVLPMLRVSLIAEVVSYSVDGDTKPDLENMAFDAARLASSCGEVAKSHTDIFSYEDVFSLEDVFLANEGKAAASAFAANSALLVESMMTSFAADSDLIYNGFWTLIRADVSNFQAGSHPIRKRLWQRELNPFSERWTKIKRLCDGGSVDWSFWIKWYEAALKGEPLNYEMLERIALIPSNDWEQGPKHVNAIIAEIEGESEWAEPEIEVTPAHMLSRNKSVIESQLDALFQLVTEEINRLRGQNDFTEVEGERITGRVSVLESILAAIEKIKAALEGEEPSTALAVIEEQLPEVLSGAAELAKGEDEPQVSVSIAQMGETISFLTQKGTPGTLATGIAIVDLTISHPIKWWKHWRNPKS